MAEHTGIEWTDATWNPIAGCSRVSPGCVNCYAENEARRLGEKLQLSKYAGLTKLVGDDVRWTGEVRLWEPHLDTPLHWKRPRRIFVNSMSDLFHDAVPEAFIARVFAVMGRASWHTFQVLTKRSARLRALAPRLPWPANVWQGVSVETADYTGRIADLRAVPAAVRFLSVEPLLGPIPNLSLDGIHWVIVGGESGPAHRRLQPEWVREIRDQCVTARVPFFFKQWGGRTPKSGGRLLDGQTWDAMPVSSSHDPVFAGHR